jgi:hypothetical protein
MGHVGILVALLTLTEVYKLAVALTSLVSMLVALLKLTEAYKLAVALTLVGMLVVVFSLLKTQVYNLSIFTARYSSQI